VPALVLVLVVPVWVVPVASASRAASEGLARAASP